MDLPSEKLKFKIIGSCILLFMLCGNINARSNLQFAGNNDSISNESIQNKRSEFGLIIGLSITSIDFTGNDYKYLTNGRFTESNNLTFGTSLNFRLGKNSNHLNIYNELLFTAYEINGSYRQKHAITFTEFDYSYIKLNSMFRYLISIEELSLFFNAGLSFGGGITSINVQKKDYQYPPVTIYIDGYAIENTKWGEFGFNFGFGFKSYGFSIEYRFEQSNGMSDTSSLKSIVNRSYFLAGYTF